MKKFKKILGISLICAVLFTVTACKSKSNPISPDNNDTHTSAENMG